MAIFHDAGSYDTNSTDDNVKQTNKVINSTNKDDNIKENKTIIPKL